MATQAIDYSSAVANARAAGYSDDAILQHLAQSPALGPQVQAAQSAHYSAKDIVDHLSGPAKATAPVDPNLHSAPLKTNTGAPASDVNVPDWKKGNTPDDSGTSNDENGTPSSFDYAGSLAGHLKNVRDGVMGFVHHALEPERRVLGYEPDPTANVESMAGDLHRVVSGASGVAAPLLIPAGLAAPVPTAVRLGLGAAGQYAGKQAAQAVGAGPNVSDLAGDVAGGAAASTGGDYVVPKVQGAMSDAGDAIVSAKQAAINKAKVFIRDHPQLAKVGGGVAGAITGSAVSHGVGLPVGAYVGAHAGARLASEYSKSLADFKPPSEVNTTPVDRDPIWKDNSDAPLVPPDSPDTAPIPATQFPSGRVPGPQNQTTAPAPPREPLWKNVPDAPQNPYASPQVGIPSELPSGRKVGGIQNQVLSADEPDVPALIDESQAIKEGLAQQYNGKPYAKLKVAEKAAIDDLAGKIVKRDTKPAPPVAATVTNPYAGPPQESAVSIPLKTKLDLMLDGVKTKQQELTFDVTDYTEAQKQKIIDTAEARGLNASSDGHHILVRDLGKSAPAPQEPVTPTQPTLYPEANPDREVHSAPVLENEPSLARTDARKAAAVKTARTTRGRALAWYLNQEGVPSKSLSLATHPVGHPLWAELAEKAGKTVPSSPEGVQSVIDALKEIEAKKAEGSK